jgi:hypothetical protein
MKSFVWHGDNCFFVSTINRDSSSIYGGRFAETIVWDYDWDKKERGTILHSDSAGEDSVSTHLRIAKAIRETGLPQEPRHEHD